MIRSRKVSRPLLPHEELGREAKFAKPHLIDQTDEQIDTRGLRFRKIHPDRDDEYRRWLMFQPCAVRGLIDNETGQAHVCWSPANVNGRPASDPCHTGKAYSGKLKRNDSECMPLCRHAHRMHEDQMDRFDRRFGIDRYAVAREHFARFSEEQERRS